MGKCIKCGNETKFALRYDIDCSPIYVHKKCEEDVKIAMVMLLSNLDNEDNMVEEFTKDWYSPFK